MRGVKVKAVPLHAKQTLEPQLEGTGCGQRHPPGRIIPGKKTWVSGPVWMDPEYVAPLGFEPRTVQPVASRCTNWAVPAADLEALQDSV
jgi:hypothetical protein